MKTELSSKFALILAVVICCRTACGHDVPVHVLITRAAGQSAYASSSNFQEFFETASTGNGANDINYGLAEAYLTEGSAREDDPDKKHGHQIDAGGYRSMNHFYDPLDATFGKGLSDKPVDHRKVAGTNSFSWASISNCVGIDFLSTHPINIWSWQNGRSFESAVFMSAQVVDRKAAATNMFRAMGQVMHLLEDTSQPQHVRNEQHWDGLGPQAWYKLYLGWESPIEDWGVSNKEKLEYQHGLLPWKADGIKKMEEFWDRHKYNGTVIGLDDDLVGGTNTLGLAEWCNGNFVGDRHSYSEYFPKRTADIRWYPFPARASGSYAIFTEAVLKNGHITTNAYLRKNGDGISIAHHSLLLKFGRKNVMAPGASTIKDDKVLEDYHLAIIPKAVAFSAGILDYYFRGQLDVCVGLETAPGTNLLKVVNRSGTNLLNGTFTILSEDAGGVRNQIASNSFTGRLEDGSSMTMSFPTNASASSYMVVYQGTIGSDGTTPLDSVDAGIAIAARRFTIPVNSDADISPDEWKYGTWVTNGQVVAVADPDSRDEKPASRYRVRYMGGHATETRTFQFGSTQCTATKFYTYLVGTTNAWHNGASWYGDPVAGWFNDPVNNSHQLCWNGGKGGSTMTCADGTGGQECWFGYDNGSDVEQATSTNAVEFCHTGGKFGPVVGRVDANCVMNLDASFSPGNITFAVERLTFPQIETNAGIASLTVNLDTNIISQLLPCAGCPTNCTLPTWNGDLTFLDPGVCSGNIAWDSADPSAASTGYSLNGFQVFASVWAVSNLPTQNGVGWRLAIVCKISEYNHITIWSGSKSKGYGPGGTYTFDASDIGCANDNVCCITVQENR